MTAGTWTPVATPGLGQAVFPKGIDEHNQIFGWSGRPMPNPAGTAETICFWTSPYATLSAVAGDHQWDYRQEPDLKWGVGYPLHSQDQGTIENEDDSSQPLEPAPLRARWDANNDTSFDIQTGTGPSREEATILAEIPANPEVYDIRVFLVANSAPLSSGIDAYGLTIRDQRTCWVLGSKFGKNRNKPYLLDTIAHEIGHVFVGDGHPDQSAQPGLAPLPGTQHTCRLMCSGPNSDGSSRLLVKGEWDEAEKWLKARPGGDH